MEPTKTFFSGEVCEKPNREIEKKYCIKVILLIKLQKNIQYNSMLTAIFQYIFKNSLYYYFVIIFTEIECVLCTKQNIYF